MENQCEAFTTEEGTYRIAPLPPGSHDVLFRRSRFLPAVVRDLAPEEGERVAAVAVELDPISNVWVLLQGAPRIHGSLTSDWMRRTAPDRTARFEGLEPTLYRASAWGGEYLGRRSRSSTLGPGAPWEIVLERLPR